MKIQSINLNHLDQPPKLLDKRGKAPRWMG
jgi:hypothetical protein